jgi:dUTP pyrophosphatase
MLLTERNEKLGVDLSDKNSAALVYVQCDDCLNEFMRHYCDTNNPNGDICYNCMVCYDNEQADSVKNILFECKLLNDLAKLPFKKRKQDIGYDIFSIMDAIVPEHGMVTIDTGIAISAPIGWYYTIEGRSSLGVKGIEPFRGIIDSTYTGHLLVTLFNHTSQTYSISTGDRIAQIIPHKQESFDIKVVTEFSDEYNIRGQSGFGSSGK